MVYRKHLAFARLCCVQGLLLGDEPGMVFEMQWKPSEAVAISPEPGAVIALWRERKVFASNNFRRPPHWFVRIHLAIVLHEQPVVY
jgi:hypothetical protein